MSSTKLRAAAVVAIVAGILLLISGITGAGTWSSLRDGLEEHIDVEGNLEVLLILLIFLGSLGGITVIAGGWLLWRGLKRTGRLLVTIGVGMGLIGLVVGLVLAAANGEVAGFLTPTAGFIGIVLSIVARMMSR